MSNLMDSRVCRLSHDRILHTPSLNVLLVDKNAQSILGGVGSQNEALYYHVEATCNGILCPAYDTQRELTVQCVPSEQ